MATSTSGFFSSFFSTLSSFGGWIWTTPQKIAEHFSWFSSKKMNFPDTEHGRRLQLALTPDSPIDKTAQTWAHASFGTKALLLAGGTLAFTLLGLVFGASLVLSITSMVVGLSLHGLLVAHYEGRVRRITHLVKEQEALEEVEDVLMSIREEVIDLDTQNTLVQFKKDAQELTEVVVSVEKQVGVVVSANKQLEEVGLHIETTLQEVNEQTLAWSKGLVQHEEVLSTVIDSSTTFSDLVEEIVTNHKAFDATVTQLHEAVVELTKPQALDEDEACGLTIDLSTYTEQTQQMKEELDAFDERNKQRKEKPTKDSDLLIEDSVLVSHQEGIKATNDALEQLALQRRALATLRATNDIAHQLVLKEATAKAPHDQETETRSTDLAWLETVGQSIHARQERMDAFKNELKASQEGNALDEHQALVASIEAELKARSEQRKARRAQLDATCLFFVNSVPHAPLDEASTLSITHH